MQIYVFADCLPVYTKVSGDLDDPVEKTRLELLTHFIHLFISAAGKEMGKNELEINLDVAVADGNLDRIPGLEKEDLFLCEYNAEDKRLAIITGADVYYDFHGYLTMGFVMNGDFYRKAKEKGLDIQSFYGDKKLSIHTASVGSFGFHFPKAQFEDALEFRTESLESYKEKPPQ